MRHFKLVLALTLATALVVPAIGSTEPFVTNPFGNLTMSVLTEPSGTTPGTARLTIVTSNGAAFTPGHDTIYFGFRVMGSEDLEMTSFRLPSNTGGCIVSDFAGRGTGGWQGASVFGTATPAGSANSHMRMLGGFLKQSCGNIEITVAYRARPLVAFYAAFFGYTAAPWHNNYGAAPWSTIPTGGDSTYQNWWNIWGTFDTLGYSNACTNVTGTTVSC